MPNRFPPRTSRSTGTAAPNPFAALSFSWSGHDWLWATLLFLAVVLTYLPVWHAGFIWDDDYLVTENTCIIGPLGLKEIWTTKAADVCPFVLTTFWLEHALWGLRPAPYHVVTVLFHGAGAVTLWRVLRRLRIPGAWLGAALWALHPVQAESVAWVAEMKNTESGLFFLLAVLFYLRFLKAGEEGRGPEKTAAYEATLLFTFLAEASKSSTVILPVVLGLCAWWVDGRWNARRLAGLAPFFLISLLAGAVSLWTQSLQLAATTVSQASRPWSERLAATGDAVWFYLHKLAWPHPLMPVYPRWQMNGGAFVSFLPLLGGIALLALFWWKRDSWARPWFFAFAFFLVALAPVVGLLDNSIFRYSLVFDHFQYLASMGPLALAGAGLAVGASLLPIGATWPKLVLSAALLFTLATVSWQRATVYQNTPSLWTDALAKNRDCWVGYLSLSRDLEKKGQTKEALDEAIVSFHKALELNPNYPEAYNDLGNTLLKQGKIDEAIASYRKAIELNPRFAAACSNLGNVLRDRGDIDGAIALYQRSVELDPAISSSRNNLGMLFLQKGNLDAAEAQFQKVLAFDPNNDLPHYCLGLVYFREGQKDRAMAEFQRAVEINPNNAAKLSQALASRQAAAPADDPVARYQKAVEANPNNAGAYNDLGSAYAQTGKFDQAIIQYRKSLELNPQDAMCRYNLGAVLLQKGNLDEAIAQLLQVAKLAPNNDLVHYCLGVAYSKKGDTAGAIAEFQQALKINPNNALARQKLDAAQGH